MLADDADASPASTDDAVALECLAYVARAPFHPQRFAAALRANFDALALDDGDVVDADVRAVTPSAFDGVVRASGVVWIASRPRTFGTFRVGDGDDAETEDDADGDESNTESSSEGFGPRVVRVECVGAWDVAVRGACDEPPASEDPAPGCGDRRQHIVFEGVGFDAEKIKECLDACLLTEAEDADEINRASEMKWYCGSVWPSATEVMDGAGVAVVDAAAKCKVFYPSAERRRVIASTASTDDSKDTPPVPRLRLGGSVGIVVPEAFELPEDSAAATKIFPDGQTGHFFADMPCLECGSPWWFGESWESKCANCGADDRTYGSDQQPIRSRRRAFEAFVAELRRLEVGVGIARM